MSTLLVSLTNCSPLGPQYRVIQQGTLYTQEDVDQITIGMTQGEVLEILGDPLSSQTFDPDRIEYVYTLEERGDIVQSNRVTIEFENNRVIHIEES